MTREQFRAMPKNEQIRFAKRVKELRKRRAGRKLLQYFPAGGPLRRELYPKHMAFFAAGAEKRERCMMAANRVGKTESCGGYEMVLHLTGDYPEWWPGRRFTRPIKAWAAGDTSETVRDIIQAKLLGRWGEFGTGLIPADTIARQPTRRRNVPEAVLDIFVKHVSGGVSVLTLKSYDQGRKKFQGTEVDVIWLDEEPPADIYSECLTRTMTTGGMVMLTFTPLSGMSEVVLSYIEDKGEGKTKALIQAGWDDVPHLTEKDKAELTAGLRPHEIDARSKGKPSLGSGAVFPVDETKIKIDPIAIPAHWVQIGGMDFGWDHPTAAVKLAWDRDQDIIYVVDEYREAQRPALEHAALIRAAFGEWLPMAWPHDGHQHDKGSGEVLADQYRAHGLKMLSEMASFDEGGNSVEAGLQDMLDRMISGRWKVFSTCTMWFEEFRIYHRKDGKLVKLRDDLISASRYGLMMKRFAKVKQTRSVNEQSIMSYESEY